jgi:proline iminopeptidase
MHTRPSSVLHGAIRATAPIWLAALLVALVAAGCETLDPNQPGNLVPPTVAEDPGLPAIDMNGSRFHLETMGDPTNPVIVFLHGGPGGDYRGFQRLTQRHNGYSLTDEYFLVLWDQRSSGLSTRHDKDVLTIDQYTNDLNTLVDRYSPGRAVFLIGVSWGGMYATEYINKYPQKVAGAVLVEPGPMDGVTMERLRDDLYDIDLGSEWLNDWAWSGQFISPDDHARMDYERMLGVQESQPHLHLSTEDPEPGWRMGAAANKYLMEDGQNADGVFDYNFTTHLSAFTTPVLFIAGSLSEVLGPSLQQEQVKHYPSATLEVVDNVGHDVAWVKAQEVHTLIRAYLDARKGGL